MKRKLLCLLLAVSFLLSSAFLLIACGNDAGGGGGDDHTCVDDGKDGYCDICGKKMPTDPKHKQHVDGDGDGKCDVCGADMGGPTEESPYEWDETKLIYKMTKNSNQQELPCGCERYMAGEDLRATETVDDMVRERNAKALKYANVSVLYDYYPDTSIPDLNEAIYTTIMSKADDIPDIYCNSRGNLVSVSLKGGFANLFSTSRGVGDLKGENYFQFLDKDYDEEVDNRGYMYEYMTTTTLSKFKMYVLASDYCTDMVRAFLVVPVGVKLLNSVVGMVEEDRTDDGVVDIDDFYAMVKNGEWTYPKMMDYCDKIYVAAPDNMGGTTIMDERVGFAAPTSTALASIGFLYTTSIIIIHRDWDEVRDDYHYYYPETNPELTTLAANLSALMHSTGVTYLGDKTYTEYATAAIAIRERFAQGHLLFGGIICVGSLEYDSYQDMKNGANVSAEDLANANYGFGVVPVPLYRENSDDRYLTQINAIGKAIGISATTLKFAQCSAYLDYQSTHSTDILNEYYDYKLQYDVAGGTEGNVYMLQYIRKNVRTAFDYIFESAIGEFFKESDDQAVSNKWVSILRTGGGGYNATNMTERYAALYPVKEQYLKTLIAEYDKLPD